MLHHLTSGKCVSTCQIRNVRARVASTEVKRAPPAVRTLKDLVVLKGLPVLGMVREYAKPDFELEHLFEKLGTEHFMIDLGPAGGMSLATRTTSDLQAVLAEKSDIFQITWPETFQKLVFPKGKVVPDEESGPWRRALLKSLSQDQVMRLHLPLMIEQFQSTIQQHAQSGEEVLWYQESKRLAFTVACRTLLGEHITQKDVDTLLPLEHDMSRGFISVDFGVKEGVPFTPFWKGMQARKEIIRYFAEKIENLLEARAELSQDTIVGKFLAHLTEEGVPIASSSHTETAERLARELVFLQFVGTDTTAYALSRNMQWMAKHPQWLDALWTEQQRLIEEFGPSVDRQVLSRSAVAMAVVQESQRLTPSVRVLHRRAVEDTQVGDIQVPAGTNIAAAVSACCKRTGSGTSEFDPDQWLSADRTKVTPNRDPGNIAFGAGPRSCVGNKLSTAEMLLALVLLAREVKSVDMSLEEMNRHFNTKVHPTNMPLRLIAREI